MSFKDHYNGVIHFDFHERSQNDVDMDIIAIKKINKARHNQKVSYMRLKSKTKYNIVLRVTYNL